MMKLECQLLPEDYVKAQYLHVRPSTPVLWVGWILVALYPFFLAMMVSVAIRSGDWVIVSLIAFVGLWLILFFLVFLPRGARKIFLQQKTLQVMSVSEINGEGLITTNSTGHANQKWEDFTKYKRSKGLILVYQSDAIFQMFPKRWFTEEQYAEFEDYLRQALGKSS